MNYRVQMQIRGADANGWEKSTQFPSIVLEGDVHGLSSVEEAEKLAQTMFESLLDRHGVTRYCLKLQVNSSACEI